MLVHGKDIYLQKQVLCNNGIFTHRSGQYIEECKFYLKRLGG